MRLFGSSFSTKNRRAIGGIARPAGAPSTAQQDVERHIIEPVNFGGNIQYHSTIPPIRTVIVPAAMNMRLKRLNYQNVISIGAAVAPVIEVLFGNRSAYRNELIQLPYIVMPEPDGYILLNLDIPPATTLTLRFRVVDATSLAALAFATALNGVYGIEGELWQPKR